MPGVCPSSGAMAGNPAISLKLLNKDVTPFPSYSILVNDCRVIGRVALIGAFLWQGYYNGHPIGEPGTRDAVIEHILQNWQTLRRNGGNHLRQALKRPLG